MISSKLSVAVLVCCGLSLNGAAAIELCVTRLPNLPEHLTNNAVTSVQNSDGSYSLYSFTGIAGETVLGTNAMLRAYRLDTSGGGWTAIADAPGIRVGQNPRPKVGASAVTVAGEVYLLGGYSIPGAEITERRFYRYDPVADDYVELADVPTEVDDTVVGVFQDRYIYTVSGWHGPSNNNTQEVQVYDTLNNTWENATSIPGPFRGLFGHAGGLIGDKIIAFDGVKTTGGNFTIDDSVLVGQIDPNDLTNISWQELPAHPGAPTYRAAASQVATADGRLLVIGGTDNPYNYTGIGYDGIPADPLDQALLFDPETGVWEELAMVGDPLATMDHRGLVSVGDNMWATIGGMVEPRIATNEVVLYQLVDDGHVCGVPEPAGGSAYWLAAAVWFGLRRRKLRSGRFHRCR